MFYLIPHLAVLNSSCGNKWTLPVVELPEGWGARTDRREGFHSTLTPPRPITTYARVVELFTETAEYWCVRSLFTWR